MNPHARPKPSPAASPWASAEEPTAEQVPPLSQILAHYRRHGTLAGSVARSEVVAAPPPAAAAPFSEQIDGLHTRELDGRALFEHYFGTAR
ncbi:hypothetical protein HLB44_20275 [Aquincola sp. S2]|uniref:Uncharacterized protein n=1 Tax=Pseudaquabacterium terrae TaxID=2732868 RepID=A0ABX2ELE0_9BURK|nr:hypothetical protein [Aquabacterium terrae]NRF69339.1 hypothetical protein [Aquabacterium terrae]